MKYILLIFLSFSLISCQTWSEQYSEDYKIYLAGRADCAENDKFVVKVPQANGLDPIEISSPAGHCSDIPTPKHSGEIYTPLISAGILAGATVGTQYLNNRANIKMNSRNAEASEFISRENRLSNQSMFEVFGNISSSNSDITQSLITTNENLIGQLTEPPGDDVETPDSVTSP